MKKLVLFFAALFATIAAAAQPVIDFSVKDHDFGKINEADGKVTTVFEFTNTGNTALVISNVRASCGCTTPNWTKTPIEPGKTGQVTATYNPNGRPGKFTKTITVTANTNPEQTRLTIRGEVIPKSASPAQKYSIRMGDLGVTKKSVDFGNVNKGTNKNVTLEIANLGTATHTVTVLNNDAYVVSDAQATTIEAGKVATITFQLRTNSTKTWGPVEPTAYIVVDGKQVKDDTYKISLKGNIVENFSTMSSADRANAPIAKFEVTNGVLNFGEIPANSGKSYIKKLYIENQGAKNALAIRRVICNGGSLKAAANSSSISKGKKGYVTLTLTPGKQAAGTYNSSIQVITNDPDHSIQNVNVRWTVK